MTALLSVENLSKQFHTAKGIVHAVDQVSFEIDEGHSVAVVGESGCGKSTLAMSVLQLIEPSAGKILFEGTDLVTANRRSLKEIRRHIGVVFQDPASSLNPRMRVADIVGEPLQLFENLRGSALKDRIATLLEEVGMSRDAMERYPHQFSGGQKQRVSIARALALRPKLVVLDEPTSALDVSVQAQVLNLLRDLKARRGLSYLYISHSLATVEYLADILIVMYLGRIVEMGPADRIFANPHHPYTQLLMSSAPGLDPLNRTLKQPPQGEIPSPLNRPAGCPFASRCPRANDACLADPGPPNITTAGDRIVACHHPLPTANS